MDISRLHYITQETDNYSHQDLAHQALKGGVKWIQLRVKNKTEDEVFEIAEELKIECQQYQAKLIINDFLTIAKDLRLDGIHLGLTDTSTKIARETLGKSAIIGGTANTLEDVLYHYNNGVDYVGLGPYRFTSTKENLSPILGIEKYTTILKQLEARNIALPIIAIGGIQIEDFETIIENGIHGVALASLINLDPNPTEKAKQITNKIHSLSC
jgi:thiamine-phosphate pyrophosphorylase